MRYGQWLVLIAAFIWLNPALADYALNMPVGVSPMSREIHELHTIVLWICVAIGVVVYAVMLYAIITHRKSRGHAAANFHESTTIEIIWTIIPAIILIVMAIPATKTLFTLNDTTKSDITIKITGHRWFWHYDYLDDEINFFSYITTPEDEVRNLAPKNEHYLLQVDKPLVLPIGKKVRLLVTAQDVIHSWWVPDLGIKKDGIPGFINEIWTLIDTPGTYRGQCAELCGAKHGFMPIVVEAKTQADYEAWIKGQKEAKANAGDASNKQYTLEELMDHGEKEYKQVCAMCHQNSGQGLPPTFPSLVKSPIVTQAEHKIEHIRQVLHGKNAMPAFAAQKSDFDIAAIVTYERNAWGNDTKDVIQPKDVKEIREKK